MIENINPTDRLVFDLNMYQVDYNEQKIKSLRKEISEKYGVPLKNVEVNFNPITVKDDGSKISLASRGSGLVRAMATPTSHLAPLFNLLKNSSRVILYLLILYSILIRRFLQQR